MLRLARFEPIIVGITRLATAPQALIFYERRISALDKLFVGIDISKKDNAVYIMKPDGAKHSSFQVANSPGGTRTLSQRTVAALNELNLTSVKIGLEATSIYGDNLVYQLREDGELGAYDRDVYVLNPRQVKAQKDTFNDLPKNDPVDAFVVAEVLRIGRVGRPDNSDQRFDSLQILTRGRFHAVHSLVREKQSFTNHLFLKFSGLEQTAPFSDTFGAASLAFIEEFESIDDVVNTSLEDLAKFLSEKSKNHFDNPVAVAEAVKKAVHNSYRLPSTVANSVNQLLAISASTIRALEKSIKAFDIEIARIMEVIPNTLTSVPGIGKVFTAGLVAEIGDISQFQSQAAIAKYAGLAWKEHKSGSFEADNTPRIKSGNRYLRYYLCEAANSLRNYDQDYREFYWRKYHEVNKHQHKRALVLTARKFVRLVYKLLKDQCLYNPPGR